MGCVRVVCAHVCLRCRSTQGPTHVWRLEDNLLDRVFSFHHQSCRVGFWLPALAAGAFSDKPSRQVTKLLLDGKIKRGFIRVENVIWSFLSSQGARVEHGFPGGAHA